MARKTDKEYRNETGPPKIDEKTVWLVGISGGKDSVASLLWALHYSDIPKDRLICTFCDTGNEHEWTYAHIEKVSKDLHPVLWLYPKLDFFELALARRRFPSPKARFCTQELKIFPTEKYIKSLQEEGLKPISISGVRADESEDRKSLPEWDVAGWGIAYPQWRPLIRWSLQDVLDLHEAYDFPTNPLYAAGAQRVGCFPCIMSRKAELRNITLNFPERLDMIRKAEQQFESTYGRYSSFFASDKVPLRYRSKDFIGPDGREHKVCTIDDVAKWSLTGKRCKGSYKDDPPEGITCHSGFCE